MKMQAIVRESYLLKYKLSNDVGAWLCLVSNYFLASCQISLNED